MFDRYLLLTELEGRRVLQATDRDFPHRIYFIEIMVTARVYLTLRKTVVTCLLLTKGLWMGGQGNKK